MCLLTCSHDLAALADLADLGDLADLHVCLGQLGYHFVTCGQDHVSVVAPIQADYTARER